MTALTITARGHMGVPDEVARLLDASWAPETRRAYQSQLRMLEQWCNRTGHTMMPLSPEALASHLADAEVSPSTLSQRVAAVNAVHRMAGLNPPGDHQLVRSTLAGIRRTRAHRPRIAAAATDEQLVAVLTRLQRQRTWPDGVSARRDAALLLLGWATARRRSELAAARCEDLTFTNDGLQFLVRRSKTDQDGAGHLTASPVGRTVLTCVGCAVHHWLALVEAPDASERMGVLFTSDFTEHHCEPGARDVDGPLLRTVTRHGHIGAAMSSRAVGEVVRRRFTGQGFTGHSLRAGFITTAARNGADVTAIMNQTGQRDPATVIRYIRHHSPLTQNAVTQVGL